MLSADFLTYLHVYSLQELFTFKVVSVTELSLAANAPNPITRLQWKTVNDGSEWREGGSEGGRARGRERGRDEEREGGGMERGREG